MKQLLRLAETGELPGVAVLAMLGGFDYEVYATGLAIHVPELARGMLRSVDDKLGTLVGSK